MGKLVFVNRYFYPDHAATSQLLTDLALDLAGRGADVRVVTGRQRYDDPAARLASHERVKGVQVWRVPTTRFGRGRLAGRALDYLSFYLSAGYRLWRQVRRGDMIVAKTDPPLISVVAAAVARLRGATLVNWLQDLFPEVAGALEVKGAGGGIAKRLKALRNRSLNRAVCNVVLGELMARRLVDEGVDPGRIRIIANWTADDVVPVPRDGSPLRRAWGLEDKFVIAYSGNLGRAHEFDTILEAAERLWEEKDVVFLFIGGGARVEDVKRRVATAQLNNVLFKPYQPRERLSESLSCADVHLVTLRPALEGLIVPSKAYGALAAGRPVVYIGDPKGEIPNLLARRRCGYTVAIGDSYGLASRLRGLSRDPALAQRLGSNGRDAYQQGFRQALALEAWAQVLGCTPEIADRQESGQQAPSQA